MVKFVACLLIAMSLLATSAVADACALGSGGATEAFAGSTGDTPPDHNGLKSATHHCCGTSHVQYAGCPATPSHAPSLTATGHRLPLHAEASVTASGPAPLLEPPSRG